MRIFIDADGCPVVSQALKIAARHELRCTIVSDTSHSFSGYDAEIVTVGKGADSADFKVVNMLGAGDIVVTQDYGLAAMCLARSAFALNQDGRLYDSGNIDALLQSRYEAKKIRSSGGRLKGPSARTSAQDKSFAEAFEKLISEHERV